MCGTELCTLNIPPVPTLTRSAPLSGLCVTEKTGHRCSALWPRGECGATRLDGFMCSASHRRIRFCLPHTALQRGDAAATKCKIMMMIGAMCAVLHTFIKTTAGLFPVLPLEAELSVDTRRCAYMAWDVLRKQLCLLAEAKTRASVHN